jgi:hypothetical protein
MSYPNGDPYAFDWQLRYQGRSPIGTGHQALLREYPGCGYQDLRTILKEGEKYGYARKTTRQSGNDRWEYELDLDYARYNLSRLYEQRYPK